MSDSASLNEFHTAPSIEGCGDGAAPSRVQIDRTLAHDLRSPLNAIIGLCDLLSQSEPLTDRQKDFLHTLTTAVGTLKEKVNRLLENNGQPALLPAASLETRSSPSPPAEDTHRQRVLVVDDYAPNALVVATYLEKFGYDYDVADNGVEAVSLARRKRYIACLMDVQMHDMDGIEATMAIRDFERQERRPHLPIIGITAHALSGDRERCIAAGMDAYVAKPFNPLDLETRLAAITAR